MERHAIVSKLGSNWTLRLIVALSLGVASFTTTLILVGFFAALFVNGSSLLDARVMRLELDPRVWREVENVSHGFSVGDNV